MRSISSGDSGSERNTLAARERMSGQDQRSQGAQMMAPRQSSVEPSESLSAFLMASPTSRMLSKPSANIESDIGCYRPPIREPRSSNRDSSSAAGPASGVTRVTGRTMQNQNQVKDLQGNQAKISGNQAKISGRDFVPPSIITIGEMNVNSRGSAKASLAAAQNTDAIMPANSSSGGNMSGQTKNNPQLSMNRVSLLQKATRVMGKSKDDSIYFSVIREQGLMRSQKKGFREKLRKLMNTSVIRAIIIRFKTVELFFSRKLYLRVDIMSMLGRPDPAKYSRRTLFLFHLDPPHPMIRDIGYYVTLVRRVCIFLAEWPPWGQIILCLILANAVALTTLDPLDTPALSNNPRRTAIDQFMKFCCVIFLLEMCAFLIAHGAYFSGPGAYLKSNWNKVDFLLCLTGILEFIPNLPSGALNALRTFRLLRPLRAITRFPQLRLLIVLVASMLPLVWNITSLVLVQFFFFGLIGVQLWEGLMRRRCFHIHTGQPYAAAKLRVCTKYDSVLPGVFLCPTNYSCIDLDSGNKDENPYIGFDNILHAVVTIMQVMTLEGWGSLMDYTIDGYNPLSAIYFGVLVVCVPILTLKLFIAVMVRKLRDLRNQEMLLRTSLAISGCRMRLMTEWFEQWREQCVVLRIRRDGALVRLGALLVKHPLQRVLVKWKVLVLGELDGSTDSGMVCLRLRRARMEREAAAAGAFSLDCKIALLMGSHPRLGRSSTLYKFRSEGRFWKIIIHYVSEVMRKEMRVVLMDLEWHEESSATLDPQIMTHEPGPRWSPLHILHTLAGSARFELLVNATSVLNGVFMMMEHERDSTVGRLWTSDRGFQRFNLFLASGFISISVIFCVELIVKLSSLGVVKYFSTKSHWLDAGICLVSIIDLPYQVQEYLCLAQQFSRLCAITGVSSNSGFLTIVPTLRVIRLLSVIKFFPGLSRQFFALMATLKPLGGLLALGSLCLLTFIAMGLGYFGGLFFDLVTSETKITTGANVMVTLPTETNVFDFNNWKPARVVDIDVERRTGYKVLVLTGFTTWATTLDPSNPYQWATTPMQAGPEDCVIQATIPRENFNTFFIAFMSIFQIVFLKSWHDIYTSAVKAVGPASCLYVYSLIIGGSFLFYSLAVAIIITTIQRGVVIKAVTVISPHEVIGSDEEDPNHIWTRIQRLYGRVNAYFARLRSRFEDKDFTGVQIINDWVNSKVYRGALLVLIGFNCGSLILNRPNMSDTDRQFVQSVLVMSNIGFSIDLIMQILGAGRTYVLRARGLIDTFLLVVGLVDQIVEFARAKVLSDGNSGLALLRFLRIFRVIVEIGPVTVNRNSQTFSEMMTTFKLCIYPLLNMIGLAIGIFTCFAVFGMQILGGKLNACTDPLVYREEDCLGQTATGVPRVWSPYNINFDWFGGAMQAVWVVAVANDWPMLMWQGVDATGRVTGPYENNNLAIALFYILVAVSTGVIVMNSGVGVYMASYTNARRVALGKKIILPKPHRRQLPVIYQEPETLSPLRQFAARLIESPVYEGIINVSVILSLASLAIEVLSESESILLHTSSSCRGQCDRERVRSCVSCEERVGLCI